MNNYQIQDQDLGIDFYNKIFKELKRKWYFIGFSLFISVLIGFLFIKSSQPGYENKTVILVSNKSERSINEETMRLQEMFSTTNELEDECTIISSFPVVFETTKLLNLNISYYIKDNLIRKNIYKNSPFTVLFDNNFAQPTNVFFEIRILSNEKFVLSCDENNEEIGVYDYQHEKVQYLISDLFVDGTYNFGEEINNDHFKFKIILNGNFKPDSDLDNVFYFKFNNIESLTFEHQEALDVKMQSLQSFLIDIIFIGNNPLFATDFLNTLTDVYLQRNLDKKNNIANKTIEFIDEQIEGIADTLGITAAQLKKFRTDHNVMDINFLAESVYEQMRELEDQRAVLLVESKYYDYIKQYFESNQNLTDLLAPSAMGVDDPQLSNLINELTSINAQRALILDNKNFNHPNLPNLNAQISNLKNTILENINYIVNTSTITINDINKRIAELEGQVKNLPSIEKELINIERDFHVNDAIYTLLLETRAGAEIAKASNSPDYEIIEPANYSSALQVTPRKKIIYLVSIFIGLLIPFAVILLSSNFKESFDDKKELEKLTKAPFIGSITRNDKKSKLPILEHPKSMIAESFRSARTSLQFFNKGQSKQKMLITSSVSGDGKTFIAINLAAAFSQYGKKTLLLEFDLRNPKLSEYLDLENIKGLSSYLINDARLEDIIQKTSIKNFDVIPTGDIPPNPVELIASDNTRNLIEILESIYDYIIIDTPPVGIVTDSFLLLDYSDANIFTVRLNHTNKKIFTSLMKDFEQKEISNLAILINDDEEKAYSSYYDDKSIKLSFLGKKLKTIKSLMKRKKA